MEFKQTHKQIHEQIKRCHFQSDVTFQNKSENTYYMYLLDRNSSAMALKKNRRKAFTSQDETLAHQFCLPITIHFSCTRSENFLTHQDNRSVCHL